MRTRRLWRNFGDQLGLAAWVAGLADRYGKGRIGVNDWSLDKAIEGNSREEIKGYVVFQYPEVCSKKRWEE